MRILSHIHGRGHLMLALGGMVYLTNIKENEYE